MTAEIDNGGWLFLIICLTLMGLAAAVGGAYMLHILFGWFGHDENKEKEDAEMAEEDKRA